uniref:TolC family protein n=1 Tax=Roseihalotalea indica TaxID=2867963 RepID=A0AA49GK50_9BACT|nr:TolC family protein [Tunicatimonas sp. TK19036]
MALGILTQYNVHAQTADSEVGTILPLTLDSCLAYAYQNSEQLQISELELAIAKADVGITKAQGFPQLNGSVSYNNNFAIQTQFLPAVFFAEDPNEVDPNAPPVPVRFGVAHTGTASVSISQMIFDGSYFVGLRAARTYTELLQKGYDQSKVQIAEQVTKAYYSVLVNQERQKLLASNFNRLDTLLRETRLMYENGFAEKIDVDRLTVQFNNIKTEKRNTDRLADLSYLLLKFQMGMPISQEIELADRISDIDFDPEFVEQQNFKYQQRPEYGEVLVNQELVQLDLKNNRSQYLPKLTVDGSIGYNTGVDEFSEITNFDEQWFEFGYAGVSLQIPIFDGLRKHHSIQKNKVQARQLELQSRFLRNQIDLEIAQAQTELQNSLDNLESQSENLELAKEVFRVSEIKYQQGVGSNLEVVEADNALQTSETNYYSALYDALIAKVNLKKALGILVKN